jgi:hypothetical protein
MMEARNFIAALAKAGKSRKDIKPLVDATYGDNPLLISQINQIIKAVKEGKLTFDQRHSNTKQQKWTANVVAPVTITIEKNRYLKIRELASMLDLTFCHSPVRSHKPPPGYPSCCPVLQKRRKPRAAKTSFSSFGWGSLAGLDYIVTMV